MSVEADLYSALTAGSIGARIGGRCYNRVPLQGCARPFVVYHRISEPTEQSFTRAIASRSARFQVEYWSETNADALSGREDVIAALIGMSGSSVTINDLSIVDGRAQYSEVANLHGEIVDALILYQ